MHNQFQVVKTLPSPSYSGAEYVEQCGLGEQNTVGRGSAVIMCLDGSNRAREGVVS